MQEIRRVRLFLSGKSSPCLAYILPQLKKPKCCHLSGATLFFLNGVKSFFDLGYFIKDSKKTQAVTNLPLEL